MPSDNRHYEKIGSDVRNIDDEIPFDIPESWVWVRVGTIANIFTGDSINKDEKAKKYTKAELIAGGYDFDLCGFPHKTEEILEPDVLIKEYFEKKEILDTNIKRVLSDIMALLEKK